MEKKSLKEDFKAFPFKVKKKNSLPFFKKVKAKKYYMIDVTVNEHHVTRLIEDQKMSEHLDILFKDDGSI